jgi:hypothetical protein
VIHIGGNKFYNQKNQIPMKIPEFKRSGVGIIVEFRVITSGFTDQECKRLCLQEPLPVPYVPKKDEVQEEVTKMKNFQIKMSIEKDTTLNFPVWYDNGTKEAFLMHVMAVLEAIKKRGHFKDYEEAQKAYVEQKETVKSAKAGLALLDGAREGLEKSGKKLKKAKAAEAKSKETNRATMWPKDPMKAHSKLILRKPRKLPRMPRAQWLLLQARCLHSTRICFLPRASMRGTRLSASR